MSRDAYDSLYREHYPSVLGLCRRLLAGVAGGRTVDAEDAAQEAFVRGYRAFHRYNADTPFGPWIAAIASNHCIDRLRRRTRLKSLFADVPEAEDNAPAPGTGNGTEALIRDQRAEAVNRAVDALPDTYRLPLVLAYYGELSYADIADTLDISSNHVGVLLLRARKTLRAALAESIEET